jgi:hypothetical protein
MSSSLRILRDERFHGSTVPPVPYAGKLGGLKCTRPISMEPWNRGTGRETETCPKQRARIHHTTNFWAGRVLAAVPGSKS